jgi:hypothetical protein
MAKAAPVLHQNQYVLLLAFLAFEVSCGLYFPCFGTLRGTHIPVRKPIDSHFHFFIGRSRASRLAHFSGLCENRKALALPS